MSGQLAQAIVLATRAHANQTDKGGEAYILHPLRVMMRFTPTNHRIVAVLNDVVEDTAIMQIDINSRFTPEVAVAVDAITHREGESYEDYITRVLENKIATEVKVCDIEDNMRVDRMNNLDKDTRDRLFDKYAKALVRINKERSA